MNQPRVMQYVNETVVEVNVPAVFFWVFFKIACEIHGARLSDETCTLYGFSFFQSTSGLSSALSYVKIKERRVKTGIKTVFCGNHVSPKVPPSVSK